MEQRVLCHRIGSLLSYLGKRSLLSVCVRTESAKEMYLLHSLHGNCEYHAPLWKDIYE